MIKISIYYRDVDILFRGEKSGGGGGRKEHYCTIFIIVQ